MNRHITTKVTKSTKFKSINIRILRVLRALRGETVYFCQFASLRSAQQNIYATHEKFNCGYGKPGLFGRAQRGHDLTREKIHGAQRLGERQVAEGELADEVVGGGIDEL